MNQMMGNMNLNMNPMGMNNQLMTNFAMDETAMKIKAIISPYEQKIRELEEKIKQKDFEIILLKEKLNNYKNNQFNMNNPMNMNNIMPGMNPMNMNNLMPGMNPMNMNNNHNWMEHYDIMNNNNLNFPSPNLNNENMILNDAEKIQINFHYNNNVFKEFCGMYEKNKKVLKRFCKKQGINYKEHKFIFTGKNLFHNLTVAESGIFNNSNISIIKIESPNLIHDDDEETDSDEQVYSVKFTTTNGKINIIHANPENTLQTIIKKYLKRIGNYDLIYNKNNIDKNIAFIYNARKLKSDDKTKVSSLFIYDSSPRITVNEINNLIAV